jgi:hypothetical protein
MNTARFLCLTALRVALDWCLKGFVRGLYFKVDLDELLVSLPPPKTAVADLAEEPSHLTTTVVMVYTELLSLTT